MTPLIRNHLLQRPATLTPPKLSSILLQLPPSCRSFHASPRARFLDSALTNTHTLLESLHSVTSLPWVYTLPLSALLIRGTIILPLSIYARRCTQKQISLFPLISSWRHTLRKETMAEVGHLGPNVAQAALLKKVRRKRNEIYKRWGCQNWKPIALPLVQLPVFLCVIEVVRKMCGTRQGLFGMFSERLGSLWSSAPESVEGVKDSGLTAEEILAQGIQIEPSFATEGALWFPNLLIQDPEMYLPFMLSGVILLNLFGKMPGASVGAQTVWQTRLKRSMGIFALAIGPLTINIPSAMLVYWISSSFFAYLQAVALDLFMPIKKPVAPCEPKRPLKFGLGVPEGRIPRKL